MCPRISVPISSSSSFSSSFSSSSSCPPSPHMHARVRVRVRVHARVVCVRMYIYIYIKKSHLRRYMREVVDYHPASTPSFSLSFFTTLAPLLRFARTVIFLPIPFSTYNLHASIVQTDDGNYLRFSANAINQKRRSASPPGPLDRQGYPPPPPRRSVSLAPPLAFDSTRLRRLIIHD